jgi:hypothetical protein
MRGRYPDISIVLARKAKGRRELARLSFAEKLTMLDQLRGRVEPIVKARENRKNRAASRVAKGGCIR